MQCVTCKETVIANPTGTCLGCQRGFTRRPQEDHFLNNRRPAPCGDYYPPEELEVWNNLKEKRNAIEERLEQIDDQVKHQDRDEGRKASEASCSDRPPNCS